MGHCFAKPDDHVSFASQMTLRPFAMATSNKPGGRHSTANGRRCLVHNSDVLSQSSLLRGLIDVEAMAT